MINALAIKKKFFMQASTARIGINISISNPLYGVAILKSIEIIDIDKILEYINGFTIYFPEVPTGYGDTFGSYTCYMSRGDEHWYHYTDSIDSIYINRKYIYYVDPASYNYDYVTDNLVGIINWEANDEMLEESLIDDLKNEIINLLTTLSGKEILVEYCYVDKDEAGDPVYILNPCFDSATAFCYNVAQNVNVKFTATYSGKYTDDDTGYSDTYTEYKSEYSTVLRYGKDIYSPEFEEFYELWGSDIGISGPPFRMYYQGSNRDSQYITYTSGFPFLYYVAEEI